MILAIHNRCLGIITLTKTSQLQLEFRRQPLIVAVEKGNQFSTRSLNADIPGVTYAIIPGEPHESYPWILKPLDDLQGVVCRSVVNHNNFKV
jgi:hypothetical protein